MSQLSPQADNSQQDQALDVGESNYELAVDEFVSDGEFEAPYVAAADSGSTLPTTPGDRGFTIEAIDDFFDALDELIASGD